MSSGNLNSDTHTCVASTLLPELSPEFHEFCVLICWRASSIFLAILNNAAVNTDVQLSLWQDLGSLSKFPRLMPLRHVSHVVPCYVLFCYLVLSFCDSPILIFTTVALVQFLPVSNKGLFPLVLAITCCHLFSWCSDWGGIDSLSSFKRQKI